MYHIQIKFSYICKYIDITSLREDVRSLYVQETINVGFKWILGIFIGSLNKHGLKTNEHTSLLKIKWQKHTLMHHL